MNSLVRETICSLADQTRRPLQIQQMNFSLYCNFGFGFNQNYFSHEFYLIDLNSFLNVTNMSI